MPAFAILSCTSSRIPNTAQQTVAEEKTARVNIFCTLLSSIVRGKKAGWQLDKSESSVSSAGVEK
jgi:hypothetical protein